MGTTRVAAMLRALPAPGGFLEEGAPGSAEGVRQGLEKGVGRQPWALSLPDKELCLREALAVCTPPAPEPSAKRPGS